MAVRIGAVRSKDRNTVEQGGGTTTGKPTASSFGPVGTLTATGDTGTVYLDTGTYEGLDYGGANIITSGPGVTIRNCKASAFTNYYSNFWLENTESYGIYVDCYYNAIDTVMLKNNRVHGTDGDGIQVRGATGLTIKNCTIDMGVWQEFGSYHPKNAAIYVENVNSLTNILIQDVWLNGGGYTFYAAQGDSNCQAVRMHVDGTDFGYAPYSITGTGGGWTFTNCTGPDGGPL